MGTAKFLREVSVGPAEPMEDRPFDAMKVPRQVEIEDESGQIVTKDFSPWVREVISRPDRWTIFGNIEIRN